MLNKFDFNPKDYVSLSEQTGESSTRQTYKGIFLLVAKLFIYNCPSVRFMGKCDFSAAN